MKHFLSSGLLLLSMMVHAQPDSAQKIYRVNRPAVAAFSAVALTACYIGLQPIIDKPKISQSELAHLDPSLINSIDRWCLQQNPAERGYYKQLSNSTEVPMVFLPGLLALNKTIRKDWLDLLLIYIEGHAITWSFYNFSPFGPAFQQKFRPVVYYEELRIDERTIGDNRNSLYSGHVASAAYTSFFTVKVWSDYHPEMGARRYYWYAAALIPPMAMSYLRTRALDHFISDEIIGIMLGSSIAIILPELHKIKSNNIAAYIRCDNGIGLALRWTAPAKQIKVY
jgi:hypothetical protein